MAIISIAGLLTGCGRENIRVEDMQTIQTKDIQPKNTQTEKVQTEDDSHNLYERFLNNEAALTVRDDFSEYNYQHLSVYPDCFYTLEELGQIVNASYFDPEHTDKTSYDAMQYAYAGCLDQDKEHLLIKFTGLNIYCSNDDSCAVYVITEDDGQLYLTYFYECWPRSETLAYNNGTLSGFGSEGAGSHLAELSAILSDGTPANIYTMHILSGGFYVSWIEGSLYNEIFGKNEETSMIVSTLRINDNKYYMYDLDACTPMDRSLCETFIEKCRDEEGFCWITSEEMNELIKDRCDILGIDYEKTVQTEETIWNTF